MNAELKPKLPNQVPGASRLPPGAARCPGESMQDILAGDRHKAPPVLTHQRYEFLGDEDIPFERYTSREFFAREIEHVWMKTWQWVCREEHIPKPGDYYVYELAHLSFIVVRTASGAIKGYYNSCLHRGTKFRAKEGLGHSQELRCPYHGWTWTLDGALDKVTCPWDFPHVKPEDYRLPEVHVDTWGGFVFINMAEEAPRLLDYLGVLPEHFSGNWDLSQRYVALHVAKELHANWKSTLEAFIEAYHIYETHPEMMMGAADANAQYDLYGDHVSRFVAAAGVPSPHLDPRPSEQQVLECMLVGDRSVLESDELRLKPGETARQVMARFLRGTLAAKYGTNLDAYCDSEILDAIEYHLFPNMFLFPGISLPMVYRFRPIGLDPDRTLFEILFLRPLPDGAPRPEPAEVQHVPIGAPYSQAVGFDPGLAYIYDQDTANLAAQQQGFRAAKKRGQTLANYGEVRVRHLHRTIDQYLRGERPTLGDRAP
jgi:nitrite reductase/ring-hydroxylating ferredoxin subunit